jgi:hypothetical protein
LAIRGEHLPDNRGEQDLFMSTQTVAGDKGFDEAVTSQIRSYAKLFEAQVEVVHRWPDKFHFPEPSNDVERVAMRLFIDEIEQTMKTRIQLVHSV